MNCSQVINIISLQRQHLTKKFNNALIFILEKKDFLAITSRLDDSFQFSFYGGEKEGNFRETFVITSIDNCDFY